MYVVASFEHSNYLEMALIKLEQKGIKQESVLIIPLAPKVGQANLFDSAHRSDGVNLLAMPCILSSMLSVLGTIYGFAWAWGPIVWGLIGMVGGFFGGLLINILSKKKKLNRKTLKDAATEVVLMILCEKSEAAVVEKILYDYHAIGIGQIDR